MVGLFTRFAAKVLGFDDTALPEQQFAMIQDVLANSKVKVQGKEAKQLLLCLKRKHLVNSITRMREGLVFSSSGNGEAESKSGKEILNFVNENFDKTDVITMRTEREWVMLMPMQGSLYVVRANSTLSTVELKALASEIEAVLKKSRLS